MLCTGPEGVLVSYRSDQGIRARIENVIGREIDGVIEKGARIERTLILYREGDGYDRPALGRRWR